VQSTVDIFSIYDAIHRIGAEHRNIDTYLFVVLLCAAPYQLLSTFYYKYFAALPLSDVTIAVQYFTSTMKHCSEMVR
jgi:hypothetical protein